MYKIEKNIPIPSTAGRPKLYPFEKMEDGDSFYVKGDKRKIHMVRLAMNRENKMCQSHKWISRSDEHGVRVWCVRK